MAASDEGRRAPWYIPWMLLAPGLLWLAVFFVVPMITLFRKSIRSGGASNYGWVFSRNGEVLLRTFGYALSATVVAIVIGYPLAYFIAMKGGRYKNVLLSLVVLPSHCILRTSKRTPASPNRVWNGIGRCTAAITVPSLGAIS
jgi:spermidine/putrescine transport system permease protein